MLRLRLLVQGPPEIAESTPEYRQTVTPVPALMCYLCLRTVPTIGLTTASSARVNCKVPTSGVSGRAAQRDR